MQLQNIARILQPVVLRELVQVGGRKVERSNHSSAAQCIQVSASTIHGAVYTGFAGSSPSIIRPAVPPLSPSKREYCQKQKRCRNQPQDFSRCVVTGVFGCFTTNISCCNTHLSDSDRCECNMIFVSGNILANLQTNIRAMTTYSTSTRTSTTASTRASPAHQTPSAQEPFLESPGRTSTTASTRALPAHQTSSAQESFLESPANQTTNTSLSDSDRS